MAYFAPEAMNEDGAGSKDGLGAARQQCRGCSAREAAPDTANVHSSAVRGRPGNPQT
jgi:hypothetical protein